MVCRGTSATGPFTDRNGKNCAQGGGTPLLESHGNIFAPGGQGVWQEGGTSYLYYHYMPNNVGHADGDVRWGVNVLNWSGDWPTV